MNNQLLTDLTVIGFKEYSYERLLAIVTKYWCSGVQTHVNFDKNMRYQD